jgi:hypothetical protein
MEMPKIIKIKMLCKICSERWEATFQQQDVIELLLDEVLSQRCPRCQAGPGDILAEELERANEIRNHRP